MNLSPNQWQQIAVVRENECVGCTKCIQACPFDAIMGANKLMHTVMTDFCTGCGLCVPACPFDCIDLVAKPALILEDQQVFELESQQRKEKHELRMIASSQENKVTANWQGTIEMESLEKRRTVIKAAVNRVKNKLTEKL